MGVDSTSEWGGKAPVRLVTRLVLHYAFLAELEWKRLFDGDQLRTVLWLSIDLANQEHLLARPEAYPLDWRARLGDEHRRPISVRALAASLAVDAETARRCVNRLVDFEICDRVAEGLVARSSFYERDDVAMASRQTLKHMETLFDELERWKIPQFQNWSDFTGRPWETADPDGPVRQLSILLFLQFLLRFGVQSRAAFEYNVNMSHVFHCIFTVNNLPILEDDNLNYQFAALDSPPLAELREPVGIRAIARRLNMPVETVRRHVGRLAKKNFVQPQGEGWVVPTVATAEPHFIKTVADIGASLILVQRRLNRLAAAAA